MTMIGDDGNTNTRQDKHKTTAIIGQDEIEIKSRHDKTRLRRRHKTGEDKTRQKKTREDRQDRMRTKRDETQDMTDKQDEARPTQHNTTHYKISQVETNNKGTAEMGGTRIDGNWADRPRIDSRRIDLFCADCGSTCLFLCCCVSAG
jgi:hypothetical protein